MKGKRLAAIMLALLLVVSLLPMAAMAESNTNERIEEEETYDYNEATNVTNYGTVTNNYADPLTSPAPSITPSIKDNNGTVVNNGGSSDSEKGTVENNNAGATVVNNNLKGTVENNKAGGTVVNNNAGATVKENYGLVGQKDGKGDLITDGSSGNSGKVENNQKGGVVVNNSGGNVYYNHSSGDGTNPGVINNGGNVSSNCDGGTVVNNSGGSVYNNYSTGDGTNPGVINNGGYVAANDGTVDNLAGQVYSNLGTVLNNYGTVGAPPSGTDKPAVYNWGTVETNHISGWVTNNITGEYENREGKVNSNYGTVYQVDKPDICIYYYGLHGEDADTDTMYTEDGYQYGHEAGAEVNLDDTAASYQREGYKLSSYTVWTYDKTSTADDKLVEQNVGDRTKYSINAPTLLKLVWEKIVTAVASSGGGEAVPTSYNPKYIGLGSVVTINGSRYKVVEIKDDALVVVSFDALSDEDVKDLDALFAKLFTAEQQKQIKNIGQLLDAEDVLTVFGKPGNHPVFEISKDLLK